MKTTLIAILLLTNFAIISCKKEVKEEPANNTSNNTTTTNATTFSFSNLQAENTAISVAGTTKVSATATGDNLTYSWKIEQGSQGDILGSGASITYGASTCCGGDNTITCSVSDGNGNSQSKSITIAVK